MQWLSSRALRSILRFAHGFPPYHQVIHIVAKEKNAIIDYILETEMQTHPIPCEDFL